MSNPRETESEILGDWLAKAPFTLGMSSGFFAFFAHAGVLLALEEAGLRPAKLVGSSAGALVSGLYGAGMNIRDIERELSILQRGDFWDPRLGWGLLAGAQFEKKLRSLLPVSHFQECPIPVRLSAYDVKARCTRVLETGDLASAIHASCAVPGLFHPVSRSGQLLSDGGIADRPGLAGVEEKERVLYHHIVSRSPWRRRNSPALRVPELPNMRTLQVADLPRVHPFALQRGGVAMAMAQAATRDALRVQLTTTLA